MIVSVVDNTRYHILYIHLSSRLELQRVCIRKKKFYMINKVKICSKAQDAFRKHHPKTGFRQNLNVSVPVINIFDLERSGPNNPHNDNIK